MSAQQHEQLEATNTQGRLPRASHRAWEALLFLIASAVGVYGIGRGLAGFYVQGQQINLLWLAATGVAFFVLFAQMGRVHDTWPHRTEEAAQTPTPASGSVASGDDLSEGAAQIDSRK